MSQSQLAYTTSLMKQTRIGTGIKNSEVRKPRYRKAGGFSQATEVVKVSHGLKSSLLLLCNI